MSRRFFFVLVVLAVAAGGAFTLSKQAAQAQDLTPQERAAYQAQLAELEKEIAAQQQIIKETQAQKNSLQGDVTTLNAKIKAAQAQIDAKNITIKTLAAQIANKNVVIGQLTNRIEKGKESLAAILRQTQMLDDYSAVSVALGADNVSSFFKDLDAFVSIKSDLHSLFNDISHAKAQTETEKADLAAKQNQTLDAKYVVETQKQQISTNKTQKQQLLAIKTNQETEYKKVLAERQAKAAAIRAALFPLRDASAISFGTALQYAQAAQRSTGVNPALVLAILTQESSLGANVGQCYLTDGTTGAGVGKNSGTVFSRVMPGPLAYQNYVANGKSCVGAKTPCASRDDVSIFLRLSSDLGFDPHRQVVSCPIASVGGWGGAMGPAQFIPSTWKMYAVRVAAANGVSVANPWDAKQAVTAMGYLLADNGASAGGYTAEFNAAARYYAGWNGPNTAAGKAYANEVMSTIKNKIQPNIDFLAEN